MIPARVGMEAGGSLSKFQASVVYIPSSGYIVKPCVKQNKASKQANKHVCAQMCVRERKKLRKMPFSNLWPYMLLNTCICTCAYTKNVHFFQKEEEKLHRTRDSLLVLGWNPGHAVNSASPVGSIPLFLLALGNELRAAYRPGKHARTKSQFQGFSESVFQGRV